MKLYTIGYGNRQPDQFFAMIPRDAIIVDVRRRPWAWRREYYSANLSQNLGDLYEWIPQLGNEEGGTARVWARHPDWELFVNQLATANYSICLLCCETNPSNCHRRFVAEEIARRVPGLEVVHL